MSVSKGMFHRLARALAAVQHELRLLEEDLGLCAECGERPPAPLAQRRLQPAPVRARIAAERRRVA